MDANRFLEIHDSHPNQINAENCIQSLLAEMKLGLEGKGNIPMIPSYLSSSIEPPSNQFCCVLDAGGTNLRSATVYFDASGNSELRNVRISSMPGTLHPLNSAELYHALAEEVECQQHNNRIGLCFSYNVTLNRFLDGPLDAWCKEILCPDAVGKPVGQSLKMALGCEQNIIHVLNDSAASLLGSAKSGIPAQIGLILGTGVNVCYEEHCVNISKITEKLNSETMIISTEIGEYRGIPKSTFDNLVISESNNPNLAQAEKQCAGGYLGKQICFAWTKASMDGLLPATFAEQTFSLQEISHYIADPGISPIPDHPLAKDIAILLISRAAKIASILCAGPILLKNAKGTTRIAIEGSQFWKLEGFRSNFIRELTTILSPRNIDFQICCTENSCLFGAALAAFAVPM